MTNPKPEESIRDLLRRVANLRQVRLHDYSSIPDQAVKVTFIRRLRLAGLAVLCVTGLVIGLIFGLGGSTSHQVVTAASGTSVPTPSPTTSVGPASASTTTPPASTTTVTASQSIGLSVAAPATAQVGQQYTYTFTVRGQGATFTGVTLSINLSDGVDWINWSPNCQGAAAQFSCDIGTIDPNGQAQAWIAVVPRVSGSINQSGSVTGYVNSTSYNSSGSATVVVSGSA